jgi:hypothetical protein
MTGTTRTLIIDMPNREYVVYLNGELHQRAPINHTRTAKKVGEFYKHIGYTVIINKGAKTKMAKPTEQHLYQALLNIQTFGNTNRLNAHTIRALQNRGYLTPENEISARGSDFMDACAVEANGLPSDETMTGQSDAQPEPAADDQPALAATAAAAVATLNNHYAQAQHESAEDALREIRCIALDTIEDICRRAAPEALPHIHTIRRADKFLLEVK